MTVFQRIRDILFGLLMLLFAVFILYQREVAYIAMITVLGIALAIEGIKDIIFYFTMARHMVGGKMILFQGVIVLDFALFTGSISTVPPIYIFLYLIGAHAFYGVVEVLRAMEAKRTVDGPWKLKLAHGIVNFALAISCLIFIRYTDTAIIIYSAGLIYSGIVRIISALRRTAFIVIE